LNIASGEKGGIPWQRRRERRRIRRRIRRRARKRVRSNREIPYTQG
jgi:hypothetical protein